MKHEPVPTAFWHDLRTTDFASSVPVLPALTVCAS